MVEVTIRFGADSDEHAMAGDALFHTANLPPNRPRRC